MKALPVVPGRHFVAAAILLFGLVLSGVRAPGQGGAVDPGFTTGPAGIAVSRVAIQADGKVVIAGSFKSYAGTATTGLMRLNADGTVDSGFDLGTGFAGLLGGVLPATFNAVVPTGAGLVVAGIFDKVNGEARTNLVRLLADGAVDPGFAPRVDNSVVGVRQLADGRLLISGPFKNVQGVARAGLARLNPDGTLDTGYNPQWNGVLSAHRVMLPQPDGKLLSGGGHYGVAGENNVRGVVRLNADGTPDLSFKMPPFQFLTETVVSMALQSDGKVVIAGLFRTIGGEAHKGIARLNADGTLDASWPGAGAGSGGSEGVNVVAPGPGQQLYVGGAFNTLNGSGPSGIQRLNADGSRDPAFGKPAGSSTFSVTDLAVQPDGNVVVVGIFTLGTTTDSTKAVLRMVGSGAVTVPPPTITTAPRDLAAPVNATGRTLGVEAAGAPPLAYRWYKDGVPLTFGNEATLRFSQLRESDVGDYRVVVSNMGGSVTSVVARVSVLLPARITTQPVAVTVEAGASATFSVGVSGTPLITYQWRKDFVEITGANGPTFTIPATTPSDAGNYTVAVANATGGQTSADARLTVRTVPPRIVRQPAGQTVELPETRLTARALAGRRLRLIVLGGLPPWIATGTYEIVFTETGYASPAGGALATASSGGYSVGPGTAPVATLVDFASFFPTGEPARLTLVPDGIFEFNRANLIADQNGRWELVPAWVPPAGPDVVLTVEATGSGPLSYQWSRDGVPLPGATGAVLTLTDVDTSDLGNYTVAVTDSVGTTVSSVAPLATATSGVVLSAPRLVAGQVRFTLQTMVGRSYRVEFRTGLQAGGWSTVQTLVGDGAAREVSVPTAGVAGFVRVGEQ